MVDRRSFLGAAAGAVVCAALPGCASIAVTQVVPVDGALRLDLAQFPQLSTPDGHVRVRAAGSALPIYVLALADGRYAALSPVCTHLGCTVAVAGARLECPCHGSMYDREGSVLRGPAERALHRYPAVLTNGVLVISLEGER